MKMLTKISATVCAIALTLVLTIIPCFASGDGSFGVSSVPLPTSSTVFGITNVSSGNYNLAFNNYTFDVPLSYSPYSGLYVYTSAFDSSDGFFQSISIEYDGPGNRTFTALTDPIGLYYRSSLDEPSFIVINEYGDLGEVRFYVDDLSVTKPDGTVVDDFNTFYFYGGESADVSVLDDLFYQLNTFYGIDDGDFVSFRIRITAFAYGEGSNSGIVFLTSDGGYSRLASGDAIFVTETVDVLSWLPNTIDSFLRVEIFDGVSIGSLLLIVLAVPALVAVLRMLGGHS